jgi:hypothetical protein
MKRGIIKVSNAPFLSQWDYKKNVMSPQDVAISSNKKLWWMGTCGHSWETSPNNRNKGKGCPYCSGKYTAIEQSLATIYPEIAKEWSSCNILQPQNVRPKSNKTVWWKCGECGKGWKASVANRVQNHSGCPACNILYGSSSVEVRVFAEIKSVWKDTRMRAKIGGVECDILIPSIKVAVEVDGKRWHTDSDRDIKKNNTLLKSGIRTVRFRQKGIPSLGLDEVFYGQQLTFNDISNLIEMVGVLCNRDVVSYRLKGKFIGDNIYQKIMKRKAIPKGRLLFEHSSCLKGEWDYYRNIEDPNKLTFASNKRVWWICLKGHRWEQVISVRTIQKHGCPYCVNKKVSVHNCLAVINPKLSAEWDRDRNSITPNNVTYGSGKRIWWKCKQGHSWIATVADRSRGRGCPYCSGKGYLASKVS